MHYLRWAQPTTLRALNAVGMRYDSTLGFADRPGFRCGTCFEYQAIDPVTHEALQIRIRPLIAMEVTVLDAPYLAKGATGEAMDTFKSIKENCFRVGGEFNLLWHNSKFLDAAHRNIYVALVN